MEQDDNPAVESLRKEQAKQRREAAKGADAALDKALKDTFPASDPVAAQSTPATGAKNEPGQEPARRH